MNQSRQRATRRHFGIERMNIEEAIRRVLALVFVQLFRRNRIVVLILNGWGRSPHANDFPNILLLSVARYRSDFRFLSFI